MSNKFKDDNNDQHDLRLISMMNESIITVILIGKDPPSKIRINNSNNTYSKRTPHQKKEEEKSELIRTVIL